METWQMSGNHHFYYWLFTGIVFFFALAYGHPKVFLKLFISVFFLPLRRFMRLLERAMERIEKHRQRYTEEIEAAPKNQFYNALRSWNSLTNKFVILTKRFWRTDEESMRKTKQDLEDFDRFIGFDHFD